MTTPLHAALGQPGLELSMILIDEACTQHVAETDQLDWKLDLPLPTGDARPEETQARTRELAKDLAAMANTRGGLLVYGVRDDGSRAVELVGVPDLSDGVMGKRIRQVAFNFVYPPLQVGCTALSDGDRHVLVIDVPESDEAPHLVRPKRDGGNDGWFVAPYRSGPDTNNMVEKQLEGAYRQRIDGRQQRNRQLRELHEELATRHIGVEDQDTGTVVAVAQPARPKTGPRTAEDPVQLARRIAGSAAGLATTIAGALGVTDSFPITMLAQAAGPRRGLHRFVFTDSRSFRGDNREPIGRPAYACLEIHDDGAIGLVWRRGAGYSFIGRAVVTPPTPGLATSDMDSIAILLISHVLATYEELALATDYQVRVAINPQQEIHLIRDDHWGDHPVIVPSPPALEAELRLDRGPDTRAADFLALGQDLCNMLELNHTAIEHFWELPNRTDRDHPVRQSARRILGGEPNHPITDRTM